jgi:hypothetical protein
LLNGTMAGGHHGGGSRHKDACRGLLHKPSQAVEWSEFQDQWQGKGDFYPNLLKIKRARRAVWHLATYAIEKTEAAIWNPHPR